MSEYIYATDGRDGHWLTGEEIVRCRDCKWLDHHNLYLCMLPDGDGGYACWVVEPDGFCAWGEKASNFKTCKCGEDIELGNRESAVCPSCNRTVRA